MRTITVTQEHLNKGEKSCRACPISLACLEAGMFETLVGLFHIEYGTVEDRRLFRIPDEMLLYIKNFDAGFNLEPRSFELPIE